MWRQCLYCGAHRREWRCQQQVVHAEVPSADRPPDVPPVAAAAVHRLGLAAESLPRRHVQASRQVALVLQRGSLPEVARLLASLPRVRVVPQLDPTVGIPGTPAMIAAHRRVRPIRELHALVVAPMPVVTVEIRRDPTLVLPGHPVVATIGGATTVVPRAGSAAGAQVVARRRIVGAHLGRAAAQVPLVAPMIGTTVMSAPHVRSGCANLTSPMTSRLNNSTNPLPWSCGPFPMG